MTVSIIIPTLNGSEYLPILLNQIKCQKTTHDIELSIIDSGSNDDTIKIIKSFSDDFKIILTEIPKSQFNHGITRNQAIIQSSGEYLILLTQDSIPLNEYWLENLITPLESDPQVAGVFGRHLPRNNCNPIEKNDLIQFFNGLGNHNVCYQLKNKNKHEEFEKEKHLLAFFSSNNACIRRTIWEKFPYQKVLILGEDQLWAKDILLAGYKKIYTPHAIVVHSHNYSPLNALRRWVDDFRFYKQMHNYSRKTSFLFTLVSAFNLASNNRNYLKNNYDEKTYRKWKKYATRIAFSRIFAEYIATKWEKLPKYIKLYLSMNERQNYK
jgi:GT2 family glycosyltransferase